MEETNCEGVENGLTIIVNKTRIRVSEDSLDGRQILELAGFNPNEYDLFQISGQDNNMVEPGKPVVIEDGMRCNAILKNVPYG